MKFTTFLVRNEDWAPFGEWRKAEYPRLFPDGVYPANTGVVVKELARAELLLEVEAIAVRPGGPPTRARRRRRPDRRAGAPRPARASVRGRGRPTAWS